MYPCQYFPGSKGWAVFYNTGANSNIYSEMSGISYDSSAWPGDRVSALPKGILSGGAKLPIAGGIMTGGGL